MQNELMMLEEKNIWTIGHSTRSLQEFVELLKTFDITQLIDIRNYPGSKRYPHFNKEVMERTMPENGIGYIHLKELGGRRNARPGSVNTGWRNSAFRGYADYMETDNFKNAIKQLQDIATEKPTAYMCSEAVWWSCHRSLVSDYLKINAWKIWHIMSVNKATEHPFTKPARFVDGFLSYTEPGLF